MLRKVNPITTEGQLAALRVNLGNNLQRGGQKMADRISVNLK